MAQVTFGELFTHLTVLAVPMARIPCGSKEGPTSPAWVPVMSADPVGNGGVSFDCSDMRRQGLCRLSIGGWIHLQQNSVLYCPRAVGSLRMTGHF